MVSNNEMYVVWLEESTNYVNVQQWDMSLSFGDYWPVPDPPSASNYDLITQDADWDNIIGPEDGWSDLNVEEIAENPNSGQENPTELDETIFNSGANIICFDYINHDIQVPYVSQAPNINYDDSNFDYLTSVSIYTEGTNINIPPITDTPQYISDPLLPMSIFS